MTDKAPTLGVEEVKHLFLVTIDFANAAGAAFEDGKINLMDIQALLSLSHSAKELAVNVDFKKAWPELEDLSPTELDELAKLVDDNLDLPESEGLVEDHVKRIFGLGQRLHAVIADAIDLIRFPDAIG